MTVFGLSHRGAVRKENQDAFRTEAPQDREVLTAVLCDGMGGARAGEIASNLAAVNFMSHAANSLDEMSTAADMRGILSDAVRFANKKVYDRAYADIDCMGMGCTLVALLAAEKRAVLANVGDSRAYLIHKGKMEQITRDHSFVEELIARGELTRSEAKTHPKRNIITRAVGVEPSVNIDYFDIKFLPGMQILLCSDGLYNAVEDGRIFSIIRSSKTAEEACKNLLDEALKNGANDNVTAVLAQR